MENFLKHKNTNTNTNTTNHMTHTNNTTCCRAETDTRKISEAAYLLAEKNGFRGSQTDYWLEAERQIKNQQGHTTTTINKKR